eukprot:5819413-Prymnesium_polylepis.1
MLCSAPIDAASAALCAAELKLSPIIPTVVTHGPLRNIDGPSTIPRPPLHVHGSVADTLQCCLRHPDSPIPPHDLSVAPQKVFVKRKKGPQRRRPQGEAQRTTYSTSKTKISNNFSPP